MKMGMGDGEWGMGKPMGSPRHLSYALTPQPSRLTAP
jgi:hypothetical protein